MQGGGGLTGLLYSAALLVTTLIGLGFLVWFGGGSERVAAGVVAIYLVVTPFVQPIELGNQRIAIAGLEVILFLTFWYLAERSTRWWLTAAAGFQLIAVMSFAVSGVIRDNYVATGVAIRFGAWILINLTFFAGAWEAWADRRRRQGETTYGKPNFT